MKTEYFIVISLILIVYIIGLIKRRQLSIEESLFWFFGTIVSLFLSVFPKSIDILAKITGVSYPPSLFFLLCIIFLIILNFRNSKKISRQSDQIIELAQEIAMLKGDR